MTEDFESTKLVYDFKLKAKQKFENIKFFNMFPDCRLIIFSLSLFFAFTASNFNSKLLVLSSKSSPSRYYWPNSASQWLQQYYSIAPSRSQGIPYSKSVYIKRPSTSGNYHTSNNDLNYEDQQDTQQYNPYALAHDLRERFDDEEDYKKYHKIEHHEEAKEISLVYPVLLALLILGALFVPFISLFFFLAVSAFNCNGIGSGFGQVTPFFGRRRRRRRRSVAMEPVVSMSSSNFTTTGRLEHQQHDDDQNKNKTDQVQTENMQQATTTTTTTENSITLADSLLPAMMILDAADDNNILLSELSDYEFWRKQLARNTVKLRDALLEFGAWMNDAPEVF